jgi:hypothetical protein
MVCKNPRINVTFDESIVGVLSQMAKHEDKSMSGLIKQLTLEGLELREDMYLSQMVEDMDIHKEALIAHEDAWL